ncbi:type VI secretion system baseplate subunit TssG [Xanthovirga aplysinae]|uniref:type VI secretion system baseplate subunit TssG n=1 Tax=Xanthovirga aplysinae TaxID=2529853 RepID=UPI001656BE96|nr:type VI secretion system baseplate subunit TssG [Xanthovirga aplysinae]
MEPTDVVEEIKRIQEQDFDLRVEVLIANMLEEGMDPEEILFSFEGAFNRSYSNDLLDFELVYNEFEKTDNIVLRLSRDGLYHGLPEAMFHQAQDPLSKKTSQWAKDYIKRKKEEKNAKKFFAPFENEFLWQRVFQEQEERRILKELNSTKISDFTRNFWDIEEDLPIEMTSKMVQLLPWAWKIALDLNTFLPCLKAVIGEEVSLNKIANNRIVHNKQQKPLGMDRLGLELTCGGTFIDDTYYLEVCIGPVKSEQTCHYLEGGQNQRFLDVFYSFFLPLEVEVNTRILIEEKESKFQIGNEDFYARLGWTTIL